MQIQTVRSSQEIKACILGLKRCVAEIDPGKLIIYGGPIADQVIESAALDVDIVRVESRTMKRRAIIERAQT